MNNRQQNGKSGVRIQHLYRLPKISWYTQTTKESCHERRLPGMDHRCAQEGDGEENRGTFVGRVEVETAVDFTEALAGRAKSPIAIVVRTVFPIHLGHSINRNSQQRCRSVSRGRQVICGVPCGFEMSRTGIAEKR